MTKLAFFHGFAGPDLEDLVQQIFADIYASRFLDSFDPDRGTFETYVYQKARYQILEAKRTFWKRNQREQTSESLSGGAVQTPSGSPAPDALWGLSLERGVDDPAYAIIELNATLEAIHAAIRQLPETQVWDLAKLFRAMIQEFAATGTCRQSALLASFNLSHQAISQHVAHLRKTAPMQQLREACHA